MRIPTWMLVTAVAATALAGCGAQDSRADAPQAASSAKPAATLAAPAPRMSSTLPAFPSLRHPGRLAKQLRVAQQTIRSQLATPRDVRRAAWFEQLATRALAQAREQKTTAVLSRLRGTNAITIRADVEAARQLMALTQPAPKLPKWRIVRPASQRALLGDYHRAQKVTHVPWVYLAAINLVETRMGRIHGTSTAGAQGPMQFMPSTWSMYGGGGDINDPRDAILAAGRLLRANGAPQHMAAAIWHYNQSDRYVRAVMAYARAMRHEPVTYRGYWHWQVIYKQRSATYLLPQGYPRVKAQRLPIR